MHSILEIKNKFQDKIIEMASDIHGHIAPGIVLGTKMILYALEKIKITVDDKVLIVSENIKCLQDAAFSVCHFIIKENNWRVYSRCYDVGKFSIQVIKNYDKHSKNAKNEEHGHHEGHSNKSPEIFRVIIDQNAIKKYQKLYKWLNKQEEEKEPLESLIKEISGVNEEIIFKIIPFTNEMTSYTKFLRDEVIKCPCCGEIVEKYSMINLNGIYLCSTCILFT